MSNLTREMKTVTVFVLSLSFVFGEKSAEILYDSSIEYINTLNTSWTARKNFPEHYTNTQLRGLITNGSVSTVKEKMRIKPSLETPSITVPKTFDARDQWPQCVNVINVISNYNNCDKSWASAPAAVMSDRHCIKTGNTAGLILSVQDIVTCCEKCRRVKDDPCKGGWFSKVWHYYKTVGVVSGGQSGCKPDSDSFVCEKTCTNHGYKKGYVEDKRFGGEAHKLFPNIREIQTEIFTNGPVVAQFNVFSDFFIYSEGVYQHVVGELMGVHNVKILGWGSEEGNPYWLCANSWGSKWGQLGGFFKILRSGNHCGIESNAVTGDHGINSFREDFLIVSNRGMKLTVGASVWLILSLINTLLLA